MKRIDVYRMIVTNANYAYVFEEIDEADYEEIAEQTYRLQHVIKSLKIINQSQIAGIDIKVKPQLSKTMHQLTIKRNSTKGEFKIPYEFIPEKDLEGVPIQIKGTPNKEEITKKKLEKLFRFFALTKIIRIYEKKLENILKIKNFLEDEIEK